MKPQKSFREALSERGRSAKTHFLVIQNTDAQEQRVADEKAVAEERDADPRTGPQASHMYIYIYILESSRALRARLIL